MPAAAVNPLLQARRGMIVRMRGGPSTQDLRLA